ncbi:hypothetical protein [Bacillus subtilis]
MKEYEFVRVELSTMRRRPKEDYQQIIHVEIIFERDAEKA